MSCRTHGPRSSTRPHIRISGILDRYLEPGKFRFRAWAKVTTSGTYVDEWDNATSYRKTRPDVAVFFDTFPVIRRTPKGAWIADSSDLHGRRFVLDGPGKRFAHETPKLAAESLLARWQQRMNFLRRDLEHTQLLLHTLPGEIPNIPEVKVPSHEDQ